jgi:hypothetical protein
MRDYPAYTIPYSIPLGTRPCSTLTQKNHCESQQHERVKVVYLRKGLASHDKAYRNFHDECVYSTYGTTVILVNATLQLYCNAWIKDYSTSAKLCIHKTFINIHLSRYIFLYLLVLVVFLHECGINLKKQT